MWEFPAITDHLCGYLDHHHHGHFLSDLWVSCVAAILIDAILIRLSENYFYFLVNSLCAAAAWGERSLTRRQSSSPSSLRRPLWASGWGSPSPWSSRPAARTWGSTRRCSGLRRSPAEENWPTARSWNSNSRDVDQFIFTLRKKPWRQEMSRNSMRARSSKNFSWGPHLSTTLSYRLPKSFMYEMKD